MNNLKPKFNLDSPLLDKQIVQENKLKESDESKQIIKNIKNAINEEIMKQEVCNEMNRINKAKELDGKIPSDQFDSKAKDKNGKETKSNEKNEKLDKKPNDSADLFANNNPLSKVKSPEKFNAIDKTNKFEKNDLVIEQQKPNQEYDKVKKKISSSELDNLQPALKSDQLDKLGKLSDAAQLLKGTSLDNSLDQDQKEGLNIEKMSSINISQAKDLENAKMDDLVYIVNDIPKEELKYQKNESKNKQNNQNSKDNDIKDEKVKVNVEIKSIKEENEIKSEDKGTAEKTEKVANEQKDAKQENPMKADKSKISLDDYKTDVNGEKNGSLLSVRENEESNNEIKKVDENPKKKID